jgi:hypothetical protein
MVARRRILWVLFRATAKAFACPVPQLAGLTADECLLQYAQFTRDRAEELLRGDNNVPALQARLYANAYELGGVCRRLTRIATLEEVVALSRVLYRLLDIELNRDAQGYIVISHCYFSGFYSDRVCQVMSALDRGLFAGLSEGRELVFSARITEGKTCCRARLSVQGGTWS